MATLKTLIGKQALRENCLFDWTWFDPDARIVLQGLVSNLLNPLSLSTSHPFYWISFCTEGQQGCNQPYKFQQLYIKKERNHKLLVISDLHKLAALYILGQTLNGMQRTSDSKLANHFKSAQHFQGIVQIIVILHETRPHLRSPGFQTLLIAQGKCRHGPALESMTMTAHTISLSHSNLHTWHQHIQQWSMLYLSLGFTFVNYWWYCATSWLPCQHRTFDSVIKYLLVVGHTSVSGDSCRFLHCYKSFFHLLQKP